MWILAQTKSKREKVAEFNVINQGFKAFLPTIVTKKFSNSEWKESKEYLFPGYIFINLKGNLNKIGSLAYTTGILKLLVDRLTGNPHIIEQEIIDSISDKKSITINEIKKGSIINITKGEDITILELANKIIKLTKIISTLTARIVDWYRKINSN